MVQNDLANNPKHEEKLSKYGSSPKNPAYGCWRIIDKFPYKKSGYYWIKPICSKIPMRVYCDYESTD